MKIHILTDNQTRKCPFLAEHGLSLFINHERGDILFDTGRSDVFLRNAAAMNLDIGTAAHIVLSHGHYDHCGGLVHFPAGNPHPPIYVHESAFARKYSYKADIATFSDIGIPWTQKEYDRHKKHLVFTNKHLQIADSVHLLGEIPSTVEFEGVPTGFYLKERSKNFPDMMRDEQMLVLESEGGLVVVLGCSHPGVISCLHYVRKLFPGQKIDTVIGGMHLGDATPLRQSMTIAHLADLDVRKIIPLHCTGILAMCEMKRLLGERVHLLCAGDSFEV